MKNIFVFYCLILVPYIVLMIAGVNELVSPMFFLISTLLWALVYQPLISGLRLLASGKITKEQLWLNFIPFWNSKFFGFLFFNK